MELDYNLQQDLEGLVNQVERYWGSRPESYSQAITRAKAMLENSEWERNAARRIAQKGDKVNG